jgi:hypothetical protein
MSRCAGTGCGCAVAQRRIDQPSAVSRQPSAVSRQPSAVSRQPSAVSRQPSADDATTARAVAPRCHRTRIAALRYSPTQSHQDEQAHERSGRVRRRTATLRCDSAVGPRCYDRTNHRPALPPDPDSSTAQRPDTVTTNASSTRALEAGAPSHSDASRRHSRRPMMLRRHEPSPGTATRLEWQHCATAGGCHAIDTSRHTDATADQAVTHRRGNPTEPIAEDAATAGRRRTPQPHEDATAARGRHSRTKVAEGATAP